MANRCDFCGKEPSFGNNVSHSNRKTRAKWLPNLVSIKAMVEGEAQKVKVCTKCLKKGDIEKVI